MNRHPPTSVRGRGIAGGAYAGRVSAVWGSAGATYAERVSAVWGSAGAISGPPQMKVKGEVIRAKHP